MNSSVTFPRMLILLAILFSLMFYFVRLSIKADLAMAAADPKFGGKWSEGVRWALRGSFNATPDTIAANQRKMSYIAPVVVTCYAVFYSLFAFEMIMAMDKSFMSNLFGAFIFVGNIYVSWAFLGMSTAYHSKRSTYFARCVGNQQVWDIGKLTFGFCMVWGYFFFSQFLPIWYGNLPEETQWLIVRTREMPWQGFAYVVFGCCFIVPFITLLSQEVKKVRCLYCILAMVIFVGVWLQDYLLIMPQVSPKQIPLLTTGALGDVGIFLGFLGLFALSTQLFLAQLPYVIISSPLVDGKNDW